MAPHYGGFQVDKRVMLIGVLGITTGIAGLAVYAVLQVPQNRLKLLGGYPYDCNSQFQHLKLLQYKLEIIVVGVSGLLMIFVNCLLVYGLAKALRWYLVHWLIYHVFIALSSLLASILVAVYQTELNKLYSLIPLVVGVIIIYLWIKVYQQFEILTKRMRAIRVCPVHYKGRNTYVSSGWNKLNYPDGGYQAQSSSRIKPQLGSGGSHPPVGSQEPHQPVTPSPLILKSSKLPDSTATSKFLKGRHYPKDYWNRVDDEKQRINRNSSESSVATLSAKYSFQIRGTESHPAQQGSNLKGSSRTSTRTRSRRDKRFGAAVVEPTLRTGDNAARRASRTASQERMYLSNVRSKKSHFHSTKSNGNGAFTDQRREVARKKFSKEGAYRYNSSDVVQANASRSTSVSSKTDSQLSQAEI